MKICEMVGAIIGYQTTGRTQVYSWFSKFKNCVTSFENARCLRHPLMNKTNNNVAQIIKLYFKTGESLLLKFQHVACIEGN